MGVFFPDISLPSRNSCQVKEEEYETSQTPWGIIDFMVSRVLGMSSRAFDISQH